MTPITSRNIRAIGYDPATGELHVEFGGGTYIYDGVLPHIHQRLMDAESKGGHFHQHIRGSFPQRRPEPPPE